MWERMKQQNKITNQSTTKSRPAMSTLFLKFGWAVKKTLKRLSLSEGKWQRFMEEARICKACYRHTAHIVVMTLCFSSFLASSALAYAEIPQEMAVKAIVGEAANQGLDGMTAVAEVIRRRGHLKGLYGLKRDAFILSQPSWVHVRARKAWQMSRQSNLSKGATHFENVKAFGKPKWAKAMIQTAIIKDHVFYRESRGMERP